jgi:hypothetical protein
MRFVRKLLPYTTAALAAALIHLAWVEINRRHASERWQERRVSSAPYARGIPELEGRDLRILHFYANAAEAVAGASVTLCYGVLNARSVRMEPAGEPLSPSLNRCIADQPARTTTYTLHAEDAGGNRVSASFTLPVKPAPPSFFMAEVSSRSVRRGESVTLCYGARNAVAVRLLPVNLSWSARGTPCVRFFPVRTLSYTLVAAAADGRQDASQPFTIEVR